MKNISKQYQDLVEGKMSRDNFVRNCRQQFPQFVSPVTSIDDAIKILKGKRIIAESIPDNTSYKSPYVKGYIDNENGCSFEDCPYNDPTDAASWKDGWSDYETEKQMDHDEDTYNRETGGYGDLYKENINDDRRDMDMRVFKTQNQMSPVQFTNYLLKQGLEKWGSINNIAKFVQRQYPDMEMDDVLDMINAHKEAGSPTYDYNDDLPFFEMDINDPVLVATRARRDRESAPQYEPTIYKNADKLKALQMKKAQIMRDMEQEAEPEGGPIADMYGAELEKIDRAISMLYENKKKSLKEAAEKSEGKYKEVTGKDEYGKFSDLDNVNFTTFLRAVAFEVSKNPVINDDNLPGIMEKVAKAMKKDPMAYRDLVISNVNDIAKQDETRKMREVKPGNMVDKDNGMQEVKGQEKYKADSAPKTEYKKGKPEGVKELGITPKKAKGITKVMDMPGKEKILDQLKESLKKSLTEDTHNTYTPGTEVETPDGKAIVLGVIGGTITVKLANGREADYQINVLDHIANKAQRDQQFNKFPDLGSIGQKWLSSQINEDDTNIEQALEDALKSHDWYYRMSDDPRAYDRGDDENIRISQLMKQLPKEVAIALYNKYSPWKLQEKKSEDKYSKLKEFLKKSIKKEAVKFKAGGETIFKNSQDATPFEADLKKSGVKYTKTNV